jgi:hypothetical protein
MFIPELAVGLCRIVLGTLYKYRAVDMSSRPRTFSMTNACLQRTLRIFLDCLYLGSCELTCHEDAWGLHRLSLKFHHAGRVSRSTLARKKQFEKYIDTRRIFCAIKGTVQRKLRWSKVVSINSSIIAI